MVRGARSFSGDNLPTFKSIYGFTRIKINNFYLEQKIEIESSKIKPNTNSKNEFLFQLGRILLLEKETSKEAGSHVGIGNAHFRFRFSIFPLLLLTIFYNVVLVFPEQPLKTQVNVQTLVRIVWSLHFASKMNGGEK